MSEVIRIGGLELRFLRRKEESNGSLDMFEMLLPPNARMPVPHYHKTWHKTWDETIYGLTGVSTCAIASQDVTVGPGQRQLTWTPVPRASSHKASENDSTNAFDA